MRWPSRAGALAVCAWLTTWALLGSSEEARAGDRELAITLVMATPSPDAEARRCYARVARAIEGDYTQPSRLAAARLARAVGAESLEGFVDWPVSRLVPVARDGESYQDAIALVDCRPTERRADVLVVRPQGLEGTRVDPRPAAARLRLRGVTIDAARARWLAARVLEHAWLGFVP